MKLQQRSQITIYQGMQNYGDLFLQYIHIFEINNSVFYYANQSYQYNNVLRQIQHKETLICFKLKIYNFQREFILQLAARQYKMIEGGFNKITLKDHCEIANIDAFVRVQKSKQLKGAKLIAAKFQVVQGMNYQLVYELNPKTPNQWYYFAVVFDPCDCYNESDLEPGQQMPKMQISSWQKNKYYWG